VLCNLLYHGIVLYCTVQNSVAVCCRVQDSNLRSVSNSVTLICTGTAHTAAASTPAASSPLSSYYILLSSVPLSTLSLYSYSILTYLQHSLITHTILPPFSPALYVLSDAETRALQSGGNRDPLHRTVAPEEGEGAMFIGHTGKAEGH
jgi:hypothetical protein